MPIEDLGKRPLVMGILNVTPDSFSGDGLMAAKDYVSAAVALAEQMIADGADILDIGGESSRPGATPISAAEEIRRVIPVIAAIKKKSGPTHVVAVDTIKAEVAAAALEAGAEIINDISALGDPAMAALVAKHKAYIVLMHNRGDTKNTAHDPRIGGEYRGKETGDIVADVARDLNERIAIAKQAGIAADKIILDPGLGFGKTVEQNLALINRTDELKKIGYPVMLGPSRKSFIGRILDLPVEERVEGTAACVVIGILRGADIVRVHDVKEMVRVVRIAAAIQKTGLT